MDLRTLPPSAARERPPEDPSAASMGGNLDPAHRTVPTALKLAAARQNVMLTSSPPGIGPLGRIVLLIALLTLVGLIAVWLVLAL
jgi:hypothetical protein